MVSAGRAVGLRERVRPLSVEGALPHDVSVVPVNVSRPGLGWLSEICCVPDLTKPMLGVSNSVAVT